MRRRTMTTSKLSSLTFFKSQAQAELNDDEDEKVKEGNEEEDDIEEDDIDNKLNRIN